MKIVRKVLVTSVSINFKAITISEAAHASSNRQVWAFISRRLSSWIVPQSGRVTAPHGWKARPSSKCAAGTMTSTSGNPHSDSNYIQIIGLNGFYYVAAATMALSSTWEPRGRDQVSSFSTSHSGHITSTKAPMDSTLFLPLASFHPPSRYNTLFLYSTPHISPLPQAFMPSRAIYSPIRVLRVPLRPREYITLDPTLYLWRHCAEKDCRALLGSITF